jgi:hypothetical protein
MTTVDLRMHRLGAGRGVAWLLTVLVGAAIADIVIQRPVERAGVAIAIVGIVVIVLSALLGIRPVVQELPHSLVVRNPWRTTVIPWTELVDVRSSDVLVLDTTAGEVRCFALPRRIRRGLGGSAMNEFGRMMPGPNAPRNPREVPTAVVQERLLTQAKALSVGQQPGGTIVVSVDPAAVALTGVVVVCLVALVLLLLS